MRLTELGIDVVHLPYFLSDEKFIEFYKSFIVSRSISVVHVMHSKWAYDNVVHIKEQRNHTEWLDQLHVDVPGNLEWDYPILAARGSELFARHTVSSNRLADILVDKFGVGRDKVEVITTNVDPDVEFNPARFERGAWRRREGIDLQAPLVLFLGRFAEQKRPLLFLDAAERIARKNPDVLFAMVGTGPDEDRMRKRIRRSPVLERRVRIVPATPEVAPILRDADVLFQPSAFEGLAYVSYEAMAMELPQVFSNVGAQSELIDEETGVLIDVGPNEIDEMAGAVLALLADPDRRAAMGRKARQKVSAHYHIKDMVARYEQIYEELHRRCLESREAGR